MEQVDRTIGLKKQGAGICMIDTCPFYFRKKLSRVAAIPSVFQMIPFVSHNELRIRHEYVLGTRVDLFFLFPINDGDNRDNLAFAGHLLLLSFCRCMQPQKEF